MQAFADATTDEQVISASTVSFARLAEGDVDAAMNALIALKGCGPATASAILAVRDETIPFMSDELLIVSQDGVRKYTLKVCV